MADRRAGGQYCDEALGQPPIRSLLARSVVPGVATATQADGSSLGHEAGRYLGQA